MAILASQNGLLAVCTLVKKTKTAWYINYNDKRFPKDQRIPYNGDRQLFDTVDQALYWLGIPDDD